MIILIFGPRRTSLWACPWSSATVSLVLHCLQATRLCFFRCSLGLARVVRKKAQIPPTILSGIGPHFSACLWSAGSLEGSFGPIVHESRCSALRRCWMPRRSLVFGCSWPSYQHVDLSLKVKIFEPKASIPCISVFFSSGSRFSTSEMTMELLLNRK